MSTPSDGGSVDQTEASYAFAKSGQRLQAQGFKVGGVALFSGFHDTSLDIDCEFVRGERGEERVCLPLAVADLVYLDDACQQPAARIFQPESASVPKWVSGVVQAGSIACVGAPPARRVGYSVAETLYEGGLHALNDPLPKVFTVVGSRCEETQLQTSRLPPALVRLERQPDSVFISGGVREVAVGTAHRIERLQAADGAELTLRVLTADRTPCQVLPGGRCVPGVLSIGQQDAGAGNYLDQACMENAFEPSVVGSCSPQRLGVRVQSGDARVFELEPTTEVY